MFGSSRATFIISNEGVNDSMKIVKLIEGLHLLMKCIGKTIKNEAKEQKGGFLKMLWGNLGISLLGNLLTGKDEIRADETIIRTAQEF